MGDETPGDRLCECIWLGAAAAAAAAAAVADVGGEAVGLMGLAALAFVVTERGLEADAVIAAVVVVTWAPVDADMPEWPFEPGDEGDEEAL